MKADPTNTLDMEQERQQWLKELAEDNGPDWMKDYQPGSFGCHELLDRTSLLAEMVEQSILTHPACLQDREWFALAEQALTALHELYQKVGEKHLGEDNEGS